MKPAFINYVLVLQIVHSLNQIVPVMMADMMAIQEEINHFMVKLQFWISLPACRNENTLLSSMYVCTVNTVISPCYCSLSAWQWWLSLNQRERQYQIIQALQLLLLNDSHTIVLLRWWAAFRSSVWLTEHQTVPGIPQRVKSIHLHAASYDQSKAAQRILWVLLYVFV